MLEAARPRIIEKININSFMKKKKVFRIANKKIFLTYPQCDISLDQVEIQLKNKLEKYLIKDYLIVNEDHQDQSVNIGKHIHVFFKFKKRIDIKNANYFDLIDSNGKLFHGNYQGCKNEFSTLQYLLKDVIDINKTIVSSNLKIRINESGFLMSYQEAMVHLAKEGKINEALKLLETENINAFLRSSSHYEKSLTEIFLRNKGIKRRFDLSKFIIPDHLREGIEHAFKAPKKTVYLKGISGSGKTELIKTILTEVKGLNPLIINNIDSLRLFNSSIHTAIVFDDCSLEELDRTQLIALLESENQTTIKVRYNNIILPSNLPKFIIQNKYLHEILNSKIDIKDEAILRRVHQIEIYGKLFNITEISPVEK